MILTYCGVQYTSHVYSLNAKGRLRGGNDVASTRAWWYRKNQNDSVLIEESIEHVTGREDNIKGGIKCGIDALPEMELPKREMFQGQKVKTCRNDPL